MSIHPCVYIVDDNDVLRDSLKLVIETAGLAHQDFDSAEFFLQAYCPGSPGCLLLDMSLPGMNGFELQAELNRRNYSLPIIFMTAHSDNAMAVRAIKAGAIDFLTKPVPVKLLIARIQTLLQQEN